MRCRLSWLIAFVVCGVLATALVQTQDSSNGEQYAGVWSGMWDGSGTGKFEVTLERKDATLKGKVAVTTEAGDYVADFTSLSFEGKDMKAKYDFPLAPGAEVVLTATFDAKEAKGTWALRQKG